MGCQSSTQQKFKSEPKPGALKIVAISGSLRKASTNTGLIRYCFQLNHPDLDIEWAEISEFPVFNEDLEKPLPKCIEKVREQIRNADAVLFAVPQYNFKVSSPLKNAYDWISRGETPIKQKTAGIISSAAVSGGQLGQADFKKMVQYCKVNIMDKTVNVKTFQGKKFDQKGHVIDQNLKKQLKEFLDAFAKWVKQNKK